MSKRVLFLWIVAFIVSATGLGVYLNHQINKRLEQKEYQAQKEKSAIGGPFALRDIKGNVVRSNHFRGKYLLIYFGYSFCPDICPTALENMTEALTLLERDAQKIQPLFITIDPKRDTAYQLETYMENFHPSLQALTGAKSDIDNAMKAYKVYASIVEGSHPDYLVDHSSIVYFMDKEGHFICHFTHQTPGAEMAFKIREFFKLES